MYLEDHALIPALGGSLGQAKAAIPATRSPRTPTVTRTTRYPVTHGPYAVNVLARSQLFRNWLLASVVDSPGGGVTDLLFLVFTSSKSRAPKAMSPTTNATPVTLALVSAAAAITKPLSATRRRYLRGWAT
jgi:hypothetical protein